ncbi:MAG: 4Fe-4S dicluster domain-containing protein [Veillonellales bacterium]
MTLKQYYIDPNRCAGCGRCLAICPAKAIKLLATNTMQIQAHKCIRCGSCKKICKRNAVSYRVRLQF